MSDDQPEQLRARTFHRRSLQGSRFIECDLGAVVVRGSDVEGMEIDSPWLLEGGNRLFVNGVDVVPLVDAELDRRFPGRELRAAKDPIGLVAAWAALEQTWAATLARAVAMPPGTLDASVDGEWSFAQTLRHLVMATDTWLGRAVLQLDQPFHPIGLPDDSAAGVDDGPGGTAARPSFAEVLRRGRDARPWCGTSWRQSRPTSWHCRGATRTHPSTRNASCPACGRSWRRSGSTTGMRSATWGHWRRPVLLRAGTSRTVRRSRPRISHDEPYEREGCSRRTATAGDPRPIT
ncbi:DinB family protein [Serinicoccus sp. LYQ131]|uniref:DinB family protein n=1 Tax=Serinicoccus sp. LYQ131 TaxID=3378797 RepID=UPI003854FDEB